MSCDSRSSDDGDDDEEEEDDDDDVDDDDKKEESGASLNVGEKRAPGSELRYVSKQGEGLAHLVCVSSEAV